LNVRLDDATVWTASGHLLQVDTVLRRHAFGNRAGA
jgi:hypothetical protein